MFRPHPPRSPNPQRGETRSALGIAALLLVPALCCAGPALLGATALTASLGAIGAWLLSPWLLGATGALALAVLGWRLRTARTPPRRTPPPGRRVAPPEHRLAQPVDTGRSPIQHQER